MSRRKASVRHRTYLAAPSDWIVTSHLRVQVDLTAAPLLSARLINVNGIDEGAK